MAEKKSQAPRRKRVSPQIWKFYRVSGVTASRLRKECPRCGKGVYLAEHSDRLTCGKCGYTQFRRKE